MSRIIQRLAIVCLALPACSLSSERADLIVYADHVVTMDTEGRVLVDAGVVVRDGIIVAIDERAVIDTQFKAKRVVEGGSRVLLPGLVNGHTHAAMSLLRGVADDLALMDWLNNYIFPAEVEFVDAEFVRIGTELACWEMTRGGTTTFVDMYYYPDSIAAVVADCGLRAMISSTVIDQRSPDAEDAADALQKGGAWLERQGSSNSRITAILGPHANYTLNAEQLAATRAVVDRHDSAISIHVSESPFEVQYSKDTYGKTSIEMLDDLGFFDGPTIAAHVVWPTDVEIDILARRNVGVIHNPTSNMKLASGVSPVSKMLEAGVRLGLGTDGAASNNDLDMWEEMRLAALLQKVETMDPQSLPATEVLRMATSGGAEAIGLGDVTGSLEVGKRADMIQVAFDDVHHVPSYDVVSHLVYVTDEQDVVTTIVDGEILYADGRFTRIDTERVADEANSLGQRIRDALDARNAAR